MAQLMPENFKITTMVTLIWIGLSVLGWTTLAPWVLERYYTVDAFVTNNRRDGPPRITITDGKLVYGAVEDGGSPVVHPDWLALRQFYDYRTLYIYRDNALGPNVCTLYLNRPVNEARIAELRADLADAQRRKAPESEILRLVDALSDAEDQGPFRNRAGSIQPPEGYSLDRWANGKLSRCDLSPGKYVVVTEYKVPVLAGWFNVTLSFTSNIFTITE